MVPLGASNLGVLWPSATSDLSASATGSIQASDALAPQGTEYHFTVIVPGFYKLLTEIPQGNLAISISGNGTTTILDPASRNRVNDYLMQLETGGYTLRFQNVSPESVTFRW